MSLAVKVSFDTELIWTAPQLPAEYPSHRHVSSHLGGGTVDRSTFPLHRCSDPKKRLFISINTQKLLGGWYCYP